MCVIYVFWMGARVCMAMCICVLASEQTNGELFNIKLWRRKKKNNKNNQRLFLHYFYMDIFFYVRLWLCVCLCVCVCIARQHEWRSRIMYGWRNWNLQRILADTIPSGYTNCTKLTGLFYSMRLLYCALADGQVTNRNRYENNYTINGNESVTLVRQFFLFGRIWPN